MSPLEDMMGSALQHGMMAAAGEAAENRKTKYLWVIRQHMNDKQPLYRICSCKLLLTWQSKEGFCCIFGDGTSFSAFEYVIFYVKDY